MAATETDTTKSMKPKKISDIASMFGGMAKIKKKSSKRTKETAKTESDDEIRQRMDRLKHVDDTEKNVFSSHLTSSNVFDFSLRQSPIPHKTPFDRDPSPMPPLVDLPNDITSPFENDNNNTFNGLNKVKTKDIDYNLLRANLRKVKSNENDTEKESENEDEILENATPKSCGLSPSPNDFIEDIDLINKQRNESWSSAKSNEDTEIDDISSTRSNSINKDEENATKQIMIIAINDEEMIHRENKEVLKEKQEEEEEQDWNWLTESTQSSSSTLSMDTDSDDYNDDFAGSMHHRTQSKSLKHKFKKKSFGSNISLDIKHDDSDSDRGSKKDIFLMDIQLYDENGDLMIGKITTPTFKKKKEIEKKQKKRPQSAFVKRKWNYDELFNDDIQIGAIKTPTFKKEKRSEIELKPSPIDTQLFDLSDILGDDFNFNDINNMRRHIECDTIAESELSFNNYYSSQSEQSELSDADDEYYQGDLTPVTPEIPELPPLNAHNLSIETPTMIQPLIEGNETEEEEEEEESEEEDVDELMDIFCSSSEEEFEPEPQQSAFEIERNEYDKIEAEIEHDMFVEEENKEEIIRREQRRDHEIMDDLDAMFDTESEELESDIINKEDIVIEAAMQKRKSLEDVINIVEMEEEDNEPLGDQVIETKEDTEEEEEEEDIEEEEEHEVDSMTLMELMCLFRMNPRKCDEFKRLYAYFSDELCIKYGHEMVDHIPSAITQPTSFKSTKTRMLLTKMAKYVTNQVLHNYWNGNEGTQWVQLETNKLTYTFKPHRRVKKKSKKKRILEINKIFFEEIKSNQIKLVGRDRAFIDIKIALNCEYSVTFNIEDFPDINRKSKASSIINIGVKFCCKTIENVLETLYISDRCSIYRNDNYLEHLSLSNSNMMESRSQIVVKIKNSITNPIITFSHLRNNILYKNNTRNIVLNDFKQLKSSKSFAKLFIKQSYGIGVYSIQETIKMNESDDDMSESSDIQEEEEEPQSSISANIAKFRRTVSKQNIRKSRHRNSV